VSLAAILIALSMTGRSGGGGGAPEAASPETIADFFGWTESRASTEELLVQACMRSRGFSYEVEPDDGPRPVGPGMSPDEYAERYGYGIVSSPQNQGVVRSDPNFDHFSSLGPAEQQRYLEAFQGDAPVGEAEEGSCSREANVMADRDHHLLADTFGAELRAMDLAVAERLEADGDVEAWQTCMQVKGFDDAVSPDRFASEAGAAIRKELDAAADDPDARQKVLEREIATATAERSCTRPLDLRTGELRHQLEDGFIREHRAELTAIKQRYTDELARNLP
jgi:hypothetical protein